MHHQYKKVLIHTTNTNTHRHTYAYTPVRHLSFDVAGDEHLGSVDPRMDSNVPQADPKAGLKNKYSVEQIHQLWGDDLLKWSQAE